MGPNNSVPPIMPKVEPMTPHLVSPVKVQSFNQMGENFPSSTKELSINNNSENNEDKPFFVRIDKFNASKKNFMDIGEKMEELDKIIKSLENIKEKEDKELEEWKEQSEEIKDLLSQIDKDIFGKL